MDRIKQLQVVFLVLFSVIFISAKVNAEDKTVSGREKPIISVDIASLNKYVWRGLVPTDDPVLQTSTTVAYKGLSLNIWANMDLSSINSNNGEVNEVDYTLAYEHDFSNKLSLSGGVIHYHFPQTSFAATTEIYAGLKADILLQPSLTFYFDVDEIKGAYTTFEFSHSFKLPEPVQGVSWSLECSTGIGWGSSKYNSGYFSSEHNGFVDYQASLALPIEFKRWVISPGISYSTLVDNDLRRSTQNDDNLTTGVTISYTF